MVICVAGVGGFFRVVDGRSEGGSKVVGIEEIKRIFGKAYVLKSRFTPGEFTVLFTPSVFGRLFTLRSST